MPTVAVSRESRNRAIIVAGSVTAHAAFFLLLGLTSPKVRAIIDRDPDRPPPVEIELYHPPQPREARRTVMPTSSPMPSIVRPRQAEPLPVPATVAPLPMAPVPKAAPPVRTGAGSGVTSPSPLPGGDLRGALRRSTVGCANELAVGLNRRELEECQERLGKGAKDAPFIPAPMAAAKRGAFDARAAKLERDRTWREGGVPSGVQGNGLGGEGGELIYRPK